MKDEINLEKNHNRGIARIFQKGGEGAGGHTVSNRGYNRNTVGCLLKKRLAEGVSMAPQNLPPTWLYP